MSSGALFAISIFLAGVMLLLGWLYATAGNLRSGTMLWKSFLLFALPIMFAPAQLLGVWALLVCEEGLKAFGSTLERNRWDKFWFVSLFGIWELTVDKPFLGLFTVGSGESWDHFAIAGLLFAAVLPVLMHSVTAALYAFTFEGRIWPALFMSLAVHATFNEVVGYFGLSPVAAVIETAILAILLIALLNRQRKRAGLDRL